MAFELEMLQEPSIEFSQSQNVDLLNHINQANEGRIQRFVRRWVDGVCDGIERHVNDNFRHATLVIAGESATGKSTIAQQLDRVLTDQIFLPDGYQVVIRHTSFNQSLLLAQAMGKIAKSEIPGHRAYTAQEYRLASKVMYGLHRYNRRYSRSAVAVAEKIVVFEIIDPSAVTYARILDSNHRLIEFGKDDRGSSVTSLVGRGEGNTHSRALFVLTNDEVQRSGSDERALFEMIDANGLEEFVLSNNIVFQNLSNDRTDPELVPSAEYRILSRIIRSDGAPPTSIARSSLDHRSLIHEFFERGLIAEKSQKAFYERYAAGCGFKPRRRLIVINPFTELEQKHIHRELAIRNSTALIIDPDLYLKIYG